MSRLYSVLQALQAAVRQAVINQLDWLYTGRDVSRPSCDTGL